jgi:hypothetical protein
MLDSKTHFHGQFYFCMFLGITDDRDYLLPGNTYNFSSIYSLIVLYNALIKSKIEYTSVVWNNLTLTDSNKTENIQREFAILCLYPLLHFDILRNYDLILDFLNFRILHLRRRPLEALFPINVFKGEIRLSFQVFVCIQGNSRMFYLQCEQCIKI